jgi:hypothetical protein
VNCNLTSSRSFLKADFFGELRTEETFSQHQLGQGKYILVGFQESGGFVELGTLVEEIKLHTCRVGTD